MVLKAAENVLMELEFQLEKYIILANYALEEISHFLLSINIHSTSIE
jgi:hypothetical protein